MRRFSLVSSVLILVALGCSSSSTGTGGGDTPTCVANTTDGASVCSNSSAPCKGGQYCSTECKTGCLSTANCPSGLACDMSAATVDPFANHKPVGICRACSVTPPPAKDAGPVAACADVHGAYTVSNDASSSAMCPKSSGECAVTQTGCAVTLTCPDAGGTHTVTIDATNKGTYTGSEVFAGMNVNENCAISFPSPGLSLVIDCQLTAAGGAATCKIRGFKK